jgi:hypothetical protein
VVGSLPVRATGHGKGGVGGNLGSAWRWSAASAACGCAAVALGAWVLWPPAVAIADRYLTLAALWAVVAVFAIVLTSWRQFERPQRLAAFVMLVATGMSWYAARLSVHERQFDYLVAAQKTALRLQATELSGAIVNFLRQRALSAPQHPAPATWDRDVAAVLHHEAEDVELFDQMFGPQVRRTRQLFDLEGLTDRDLDAFYRHPANAFQINVIAQKLAALARRLK